MRVSVFGLGYVGSVTAACLAHSGHTVIGVDIHPAKVQAMAGGRAPVKEPKLNEMIADAIASGKLTVTTDTVSAIEESEISLIAVGTPSSKSGAVDLRSLQRCVESISGVLRTKAERHCIVIRSTVPPGTTEKMLRLAESISGRVLGDNLLGAMNPEFLREGNAVDDFFAPELVVIGCTDDESGRVVRELYDGVVEAQIEPVLLREAELMKYVNNAFHALKVTFANEIDRISERLEIDSLRVMDLLCADRKLNISAKYLRPGFAFGGSCLPKDVRAINRIADICAVQTPLLESLMRSNQYHIRQGFEKVLSVNAKRVGILGLTFKSNTDDIRESPALDLAVMLLESGFQLSVYDCNFEPQELIGSSRAYLDEVLPDFDQYWESSARDTVEKADFVFLVNPEPEYLQALKESAVSFADLCKSSAPKTQQILAV